MGIKDRLTGLMPDSMRAPLEAYNYDAFAKLLREQGARSVAATPERVGRGKMRNEALGQDSTFWHYQVMLTAEGRSGRKLTFRFPIDQRVGNEGEGRNDWGGRMLGDQLEESLHDSLTMEAFVTADDILSRIKEEIPGVETALLDQGKPFSEEDYEALRAQAQMTHTRSRFSPK